jgi:hypothetical protein
MPEEVEDGLDRPSDLASLVPGDAGSPATCDGGHMTNAVSLIAAGFGPDAVFEGRIVAELERLEQTGALRVLDVLFVRRNADSDALETRSGIPGRPTVVSQADVDEVSSALEPGQAAGLLLIEHVWAGELEDAIGATGGTIMQQGLLDPEQARAVLG